MILLISYIYIYALHIYPENILNQHYICDQIKNDGLAFIFNYNNYGIFDLIYLIM